MWRGGSEAQKTAYLAPALAGEKIACFALSEPGVGSNVRGLTTRAELYERSVADPDWFWDAIVDFLGISQPAVTLSPVTARVDQERCASCLICVRSCPWEVPRINEEGVSEIDEALCRGCGICAAECPAKVIELNWYEDDQVMSKIDALLEGAL